MKRSGQHKFKPSKSPTRSRSVSFSRSIVKPKTESTVDEKEVRPILKSPTAKKRSGARSKTTEKIKTTILTAPVKALDKSTKTKLQLSPFEKLLYKMVKKIEPQKRITQRQVMDWWTTSNIPSIDQFSEELPDILKACALDSDYRFSIDIHELRKMYQDKKEEKIRQYAFTVERYYQTMLGKKALF